jgi:cell division protein ZapA
MAPIQEADVESLAEEIDDRMRQIAEIASTADSLKIAVLTALHLAQELRELRASFDQRDAVLCRKTEQWAHALEDLFQR